MIKIDELKRRKKELCYTNEMVAEYSGVPLGTVQKVFSGATKNPRRDTLEALEMALKSPLPFEYSIEPDKVYESTAEHASASGDPEEEPKNREAQKIDHWIAKEKPSERWPRQGAYTIEDFFAVPDNTRVELIDGVMYDLMAPTRRHQRLLSELHIDFYHCIEEHGKDCEVLFAPYAVRLDKDNRTMVLPDLLVICDAYEAETEKYYDGAPELVVEVLSPSTRTTDCTVKLRKYMNAGVREYWIIDPEKEKVMVYVFDEDYLPSQYTFDDTIPVGISGGECSIDFRRIRKRLR